MFDFGSHDGVKRPGTREMTALLAGLMALNAFAIDAMIPALPDIGRSLHVAHENDRQLVVIAYFIGFASTQLLWGPLADRFGRKPVLAAGVALYGAFALLCAFAGSFPLLIAGRVAMGASAAVTRVLVVAMVRDLFEAEAMARVMSLVFMVFMLVPVLAPNIGQLILLFALVARDLRRPRRLCDRSCWPGRGCGCRKPCIRSSADRSTGGRSPARSGRRSATRSRAATRWR